MPDGAVAGLGDGPQDRLDAPDGRIVRPKRQGGGRNLVRRREPAGLAHRHVAAGPQEPLPGRQPPLKAHVVDRPFAPDRVEAGVVERHRGHRRPHRGDPFGKAAVGGGAVQDVEERRMRVDRGDRPGGQAGQGQALGAGPAADASARAIPNAATITAPRFAV